MSSISSAHFTLPASKTVTSGVVVPTTTTPAFDYNNDKIRGVNLYGELSFVWIFDLNLVLIDIFRGGWLVLEVILK